LPCEQNLRAQAPSLRRAIGLIALLGCFSRMVFSENPFPLFRIMH